MKFLKAVGYWRGGDQNSKTWPWPGELVMEGWEKERKARIVEYLRAGVRIHEDLGYAEPRFSEGVSPEELGNAELTDGEWIWPEGLWIYVDRFDVRLPEEFVESITRRQFRVDSGLNSASLDALPVDFQFWTRWAKVQEARWYVRLFRFLTRRP